VTCVIQVIGTALFIRRMPLTYYFIGAVLQFVFLVATRFAYRVVQTESARIRNRKRKINIPAMVIGSGEKAKKVK
jgi:FlaA1/EpsC-like NDP-sugar epimerase